MVIVSTHYRGISTPQGTYTKTPGTSPEPMYSSIPSHYFGIASPSQGLLVMLCLEEKPQPCVRRTSAHPVSSHNHVTKTVIYKRMLQAQERSLALWLHSFNISLLHQLKFDLKCCSLKNYCVLLCGHHLRMCDTSVNIAPFVHRRTPALLL